MKQHFSYKDNLVFCSSEALMRRFASLCLQKNWAYSHQIISKMDGEKTDPITNVRLLILDLSPMFLMDIADLNILLSKVECDLFIFYENNLTAYCSQIKQPIERRVIFFEKPMKEQYSYVTAELKNIINQYYSSQNKNNEFFLKHYFLRDRPPDLIAIGASTGGPEALLELTKNLPSNFPPVLFLVHMASEFIPGFCKRIQSLSKLKVCEFSFDQKVEPNTITCASGSNHMLVQSIEGEMFLKNGNSQKVNGHCPSIDILFESIAELTTNDCVGVLLTGMGNDGAKGLLKMKTAGKLTIAQDEQSSIVYGMPKVAVELNAVHLVASLDKIQQTLVAISNFD
jgi:chemotaxis response regulator CheB